MITNQQAVFLLSIPKFIIEKEIHLKEKEIEQPTFWDKTFILEGLINGDSYEFLWKIWQSDKNLLKMSLHHQEEVTKTGLFRVDYNSGHNNPDTITELVPDKFHLFAGKHFSINEHHIHYHVEGYKTLAWALPIENDPFPHKDFSDQNIVDIIESFSKKINLQTNLVINRGLL